MGSPRVFQTAPPHPASKARMTCSPQLVGGAEASQKGFGEWIFPAKRTERSGAIGASAMRCLQFPADRQGGAFAIGNGVYHFAAAIDAVAAGKILGMGRLARDAIDLDATAFHFYAAAGLEESQQGRLADRGNDRVASHIKLCTSHFFKAIAGRTAHSHTSNGADFAR